MDRRVKPVEDIILQPLFDMIIDLDPQLDFGPGPVGNRVLFGSAGGRFKGPEVSGEVLAGGGDWTLFRPTGVMTLDVRLTLRMEGGDLVLMTYGGRWVIPPGLRRDMADPATRYQLEPSRYYFRTNPLFETGSERYGWLNDIVCVGTGYLVEGGVAYKVFQAL